MRKVSITVTAFKILSLIAAVRCMFCGNFVENRPQKSFSVSLLLNVLIIYHSILCGYYRQWLLLPKFPKIITMPSHGWVSDVIQAPDNDELEYVIVVVGVVVVDVVGVVGVVIIGSACVVFAVIVLRGIVRTVVALASLVFTVIPSVGLTAIWYVSNTASIEC